MATCYRCKEKIQPHPTDHTIHSGYSSPKSTALWEEEALAAGDGNGPNTAKDYPTCLDCYRLDWVEVYPKIKCPI